MINILSYAGLNLQSEVCMWTLMGLIRTIFDATLFKVNANLKQVWQMNMPTELLTSLQRVIRIVISGVMLVQCFTVYVYLASYIVLLYPVFLEERPALVLPWLLIAAVRQLLCELTSLALGLGICVLIGASRPPCIKFVITKIAVIMPSLYMWLAVLSYYHSLKVGTVFKAFPAVMPSNELDLGLELAVRRRRTKSLYTEDTLRKTLVSHYYEGKSFIPCENANEVKINIPIIQSDSCESNSQLETLKQFSPNGANENGDVSGNFPDQLMVDLIIPRDADRILEQFVLMLIRVSVYLNSEDHDYDLLVHGCPMKSQLYLDCSTLSADVAAGSSPDVCSPGGAPSSYLTDFPQIFQKKLNDNLLLRSNDKIQNQTMSQNSNAMRSSAYRSVSFRNDKKLSISIEKSISCRTLTDKTRLKHDKNVTHVKKSDNKENTISPKTSNMRNKNTKTNDHMHHEHEMCKSNTKTKSASSINKINSSSGSSRSTQISDKDTSYSNIKTKNLDINKKR